MFKGITNYFNRTSYDNSEMDNSEIDNSDIDNSEIDNSDIDNSEIDNSDIDIPDKDGNIGCIECYKCKNCDYCENCDYCTDCVDCVDCIDCKNCEGLTYAKSLSDYSPHTFYKMYETYGLELNDELFTYIVKNKSKFSKISYNSDFINYNIFKINKNDVKLISFTYIPIVEYLIEVKGFNKSYFPKNIIKLYNNNKFFRTIYYYVNQI